MNRQQQQQQQQLTTATMRKMTNFEQTTVEKLFTFIFFQAYKSAVSNTQPLKRTIPVIVACNM